MVNVRRRQKSCGLVPILLWNQTFWIFLLCESKWIFLVNLYLINNESGSRWFIKNLKSQSKIVVLVLRANFLISVSQVPILIQFFYEIYVWDKKSLLFFMLWVESWRIFCVGKINKGNDIYLDEEKVWKGRRENFSENGWKVWIY